MKSYVLVGDCGGTNNRMQVYRVPHEELRRMETRGHKAPGELVHSKEFANMDYITQGKGWTDMYGDFMDEVTAKLGVAKVDITTCCLAVAGAVMNNSVTFTNIKPSWTLDGEVLQQELGIDKVQLVNDFVANGYGILTLDESQECHIIQHAPKIPGAPIACIGPGTGLGECFLTAGSFNSSDEPEYVAFPSEGGHAEFAPRNDLEFEMLNYLKDKFKQKNRVSVERVISGRGLANIYEFLCQHPTWGQKGEKNVKAEFLKAGDLQGKVVAVNVDRCELCEKAMHIFVEAFGSEAGVCALKWLPYGGLYLAGGLTPKNIHHIDYVHVDEVSQRVSIRDAVTRSLKVKEAGTFMKAFRDKGRLSPILEHIPIYAVMDQSLGQRGAHYVAAKLLRKVLRDGRASEDAGGAGAPLKRTGSMMGAPRPDMHSSPSDSPSRGVDFRGDFKNGAVLGIVCTGLGVLISLGVTMLARRSRL